MFRRDKFIFFKDNGVFTFLSITLFYFFESAQMSYFNVLAPYFLSQGIYQNNQIADLSAAYYYGDMLGLLPVGYMLDRYSLRRTLLWAMLGSVLSAFLLILSPNFYMQWLARFFCGFFGGTFSFVGGIRVLISLFPNHFTFFMGLFLSAGMFGGLICQYPLLLAVNHLGIEGAMVIVAIFGLLVMVANLLYLHPVHQKDKSHKINLYTGNTLQMWLEILRNYRNWLDCFMVVLLDTPVSIMGTLWGVVVLMNVYHFSDIVSAWIVMSLFAGLMLGLPICGALADRYRYSAWIIVSGASASLLMIIMMIVFKHSSAAIIAILFFGLGLFSSCQTQGFTWITKNMRPELIGRNSAFNSMIFMVTNGGFKQLGAYLLLLSPFIAQTSSANNLLVLIGGGMALVVIYVGIREKIFQHTASEYLLYDKQEN